MSRSLDGWVCVAQSIPGLVEQRYAHLGPAKGEVLMLFRVFLTASVGLAALAAGGAAADMVLAGRALVGFALAATSAVVACCAVGTWSWSSQQQPVKGIHY